MNQLIFIMKNIKNVNKNNKYLLFGNYLEIIMCIKTREPASLSIRDATINYSSTM